MDILHAFLGDVGAFLEEAFKEWSTKTMGRDFLLNLLAGVLSSLFVFAIASRWPQIRSYLSGDGRAFRRVFGRGAITSGEVLITLDVYQDLRLQPEAEQKRLGGQPVAPGGNRYFKVFPDQHLTAFPGPTERILGYCSARGASYLIEALSRIPSVSARIRTVPDEEVLGRWDATFINLGSSYSNIKTNDIKLLDGSWFKDDNGVFTLKEGPVQQEKDRSRKGIVVKRENPYSPGHSLLVCAGLGEWGTSGAAWFLARNWKTLARRFGRRPFLIVVSVLPQSDETAHEIVFIGRESIRWRARRWLESALGLVAARFRRRPGTPPG